MLGIVAKVGPNSDSTGTHDHASVYQDGGTLNPKPPFGWFEGQKLLSSGSVTGWPRVRLHHSGSFVTSSTCIALKLLELLSGANKRKTPCHSPLNTHNGTLSTKDTTGSLEGSGYDSSFKRGFPGTTGNPGQLINSPPG